MDAGILFIYTEKQGTCHRRVQFFFNLKTRKYRYLLIERRSVILNSKMELVATTVSEKPFGHDL